MDFAAAMAKEHAQQLMRSGISPEQAHTMAQGWYATKVPVDPSKADANTPPALRLPFSKPRYEI